MTVDTFTEYRTLARALAAAYKFTPDLTVKDLVDSMANDPRFFGPWNEIATTIHLRGEPDSRRRRGRGDSRGEDGFQAALRLWDLEPLLDDAEAQHEAETRGPK